MVPPGGGNQTNLVISTTVSSVSVPAGSMKPLEVCWFSLTVRNFLMIESETVTRIVTQDAAESPNLVTHGPTNGLWWRTRVSV